jgi:hypothetical protein
MRYASLALIAAVTLSAAPPLIRDLSPRGAQKGQPFTLTVTGQYLDEVLGVESTMPAAFTTLTPEKNDGRSAMFLVEPKAELSVGVFPIRVRTTNGISNVQLFAVGSFPETAEDESQPGGLPNTNDSPENAQPLPSSPVTVNGKLRGAERDVYRLQIKAGEKRVFEVESRRIGSAIDPVIRVLDQSGKMVARSEDAPLVGLDARMEVSFPKEGYYYVEVADARFSKQAANYYRLKTGAYRFATQIFPLGGKRGEAVEVALGDAKVRADLARVDPGQGFKFLNLPDGAALPVPFDVGDFPETVEPLDAPVALPVTINGKLGKPRERDEFTFQVNPGDELVLDVRARELGTSKLMAVIEVRDDRGKPLARAGDEPLPEDFFSVSSSKTAGDPYVAFKVPDGVKQIRVSLEDLALRGGPGYAYRLVGRRASNDFTARVNAPYINIPAGGTVAVPVSIDRKGYMGSVQFRLASAPKGLIVEGGYIPPQDPESLKRGNRGFVRNGVMLISAEPGVRIDPIELAVEAVAKLPDGSASVRRASGPGMTVEVAGATVQGSVDRQRPLTADWLGLQLPAAGTSALAARLEVKLEKTTRRDVGDEFLFRWKFTGREVTFPESVNAFLVGGADTRTIEMQQDKKDKSTGTFLLTTTRLTLPGRYDFYIAGQVREEMDQVTIVSRPIEIVIQEPEGGTGAATASSGR